MQVNYMTLAEAARRIPTGTGKPPNVATVWRWARKGVKGVRLDYVRAGRRILIPEPALDDFMRLLAEQDRTAEEGPTVSKHPRRQIGTAAREAEIEAAESRVAKRLEP